MSTSGLLLARPRGMNNQLGTQTFGAEDTSIASTSISRDGTRRITVMEGSLPTGTPSNTRRSTFLLSTTRALVMANGVSPPNVRTTFPDAATHSVLSGSGVVGGSCSTHRAWSLRHRPNQDM